MTSEPKPAGEARVRRPDPWVGQTIDGRFRIEGVLAQGGMGRVYRAEQLPLGRRCAIKILDARLENDDPSFRERFLVEASVVAKLSHPNTIRVFDYGQAAAGQFFMAMELLEGRSLLEVIDRDGPLDPRRVVVIARQIARAMREAHVANLVHRDLKAGNIFLVTQPDGSDFAKVLDFGLVKRIGGDVDTLTKTGMIAGSPNSMAPEQIRGHELTPRTDVYALGVLMFQMLAGKPPFESSAVIKILRGHLETPVPAVTDVAPNARVPREVTDVMLKCLAKDPAARYGSMGEVIDALEFAVVSWRRRASAKPSTSVLPPPVVEPVREAKPSQRWIAIVAAVLFVALVVAWVAIRTSRP